MVLWIIIMPIKCDQFDNEDNLPAEGFGKTLHKLKPQPIDGPIGNISRNTVYFVIELAPLSASNCFFLLFN